MSEDTEDLDARVTQLEATVDRLQSQVAALQTTIEQNTNQPAAETTTETDTAITVDPSSEPQTTGGAVETTRSENDNSHGGSQATLRSRLENISQVKLLGAVGSVAVFLAVVFAIQYAIQNELLTYFQRVVLGLLVGTSIWVGGYVFVQKTANERYGWLLTGLGVAVTYFSLYAAYGFEAYRDSIGLPLPVVAGGLMIIVAVSTALAITNDQRILANESILLGFLAAVLTLDVFSNLVSLLFVTLLTIPVVFLLSQKDWIEIGNIGAIASFVVLTRVITNTEVALETTLVFLTLIFLLYASMTLFESAHPLAINSLVIITGFPYGALFTLAFIIYETPYEAYSPTGWIVGTLFFTLGIVTHRTEANIQDFVATDLPVSYSYSAVLFAFIAALDVSVYYASVAGIGLISLTTVLMIKKGLEKYVVLLLIALTSVKILVFDWYAEGAIEAISVTALTEPAATSTATLFTLVLFSLTYYIHPTNITVQKISIERLYAGVATVGLFVIPVIQFDGYVVSLFWAVTALLYVTGGIVSDTRFIRGSGLAIFGITVAKVFVFDLQGLAILERILSLVGLGVGLLIASYVYSNYLVEGSDG